MSLFSALFNVGMARRVGLWALIQALPDEDALHAYLRAAYLGLAGVIIGSVLTGAAIAAGIAAAYQFLIEIGWQSSSALAATAGFTLLLIVACFALASHWFVQLASIKDDVSPSHKVHNFSSMVNDAVSNVTEGFMEGLTNPRSKTPEKRPAARRIRLIN